MTLPALRLFNETAELTSIGSYKGQWQTVEVLTIHLERMTARVRGKRRLSDKETTSVWDTKITQSQLTKIIDQIR